MSRDVAKPTLDDMTITRRELPAAPFPAAVPIRVSEPESETEEGREVEDDVLVLPTEVKEETTTWSCRLPTRLHSLLRDLAYEHRTDMTKIVVTILEKNLHKIPRKRKR
jgi:polyhydroxyalkanoate synthesis regulator phasin